MRVVAEISVGELSDKVTILEIKSEKMRDSRQLRNVEIELGALSEHRMALSERYPRIRHLVAELREVNRLLWDAEDEIRRHERRSDFGEAFIELARSIYRTNDRRATLKRRINDLTGSEIVEEKFFTS
jgi:hypothetical protein